MLVVVVVVAVAVAVAVVVAACCWLITLRVEGSGCWYTLLSRDLRACEAGLNSYNATYLIVVQAKTPAALVARRQNGLTCLTEQAMGIKR